MVYSQVWEIYDDRCQNTFIELGYFRSPNGIAVSSKLLFYFRNFFKLFLFLIYIYHSRPFSKYMWNVYVQNKRRYVFGSRNINLIKLKGGKNYKQLFKNAALSNAFGPILIHWFSSITSTKSKAGMIWETKLYRPFCF